MYNYQNIRKLNTSYCSNINELEYHIYINDRKWREMINNEDLRFFKHRKTMLHDVLKNNNGNVLRIGSWNSLKLARDFTLSQKYKHVNLAKYDCYFEYEMDIIHYLCNEHEYPEDEMDELAVIIKPYLTPIKEFQNNDMDMALLLKQVLSIVFLMFFKYRVGFENINLNNVCVKKENKLHNIVYDIGNICFTIKSKNIVKIDEYRNMVRYKSLNESEYKQLNKNIKNILDQFNRIRHMCNINKDITDKESSVNMLDECFKEIEKHVI